MIEKMVKNNLPIKQIIQLICAKIPAVQAIYLFGSMVTKFVTVESDIDLAILGKQKIDARLIWQVAQELAILLKKDVDLIDLQQASTVMCWQVISTSQRIFVKDKIFAEEFETTALSAYVRFNDERREIIEEIQKRGKIL